jgi:glycosyltransferase involved in cell wall biosynthesis
LTISNSNSTLYSRQFSIIIPAHDDWDSLSGCLRSLGEQEGNPRFEVIVVDDGSGEPAPESVHEWNGRYPLSIIRQSNSGIAAARNRGIQEASGEILVFTDADCRFQPNCLSALDATITASPEYSCFQLHIVGDCSNTVGRAEELRLTAIQDRTLLSDGSIRYLNTSGFAIRKSRLNPDFVLFDPAALRAEDTLLLANLAKNGELPLFARDCVVQHSISLPFWACLLKDVRKGRIEGRTSELIQRTGVRVSMQNKDRLRMLVSTWKMARNPAIGKVAWAALMARQFVERTVTTVCRYVPV